MYGHCTCIIKELLDRGNLFLIDFLVKCIYKYMFCSAQCTQRIRIKNKAKIITVTRLYIYIHHTETHCYHISLTLIRSGFLRPRFQSRVHSAPYKLVYKIQKHLLNNLQKVCYADYTTDRKANSLKMPDRKRQFNLRYTEVVTL